MFFYFFYIVILYMPDYNKGKIYKIISLNTNRVYYGSTTLKYITSRFATHRCNYQNGLNQSSAEIFKDGNAKIYLVESFPCNNKNELTSREGWYIMNNKCVNKHVAGRSNRESQRINHIKNKEKDNLNTKIWRMKNKEHVRQYDIKYKKINKERLKQVLICDCQSLVSRNNITHHYKTMKHISYMNNPFKNFEF